MSLMELDESVVGKKNSLNLFDPNTGELLLKAGAILTNAAYWGLKKRGISSVQVEDCSTLFISLEDVVAIKLRRKLRKIIDRYTSSQKEANRTDHIFMVAQSVDQIIEKIVLDKDIVDFCVLMDLIDKKMFAHSIAVCGLSILLSGLLVPDDKEEVITIAKAALLHDIGTIEIPHLIGKRDKTPREKEMWKEHVRYGYYMAKEKGMDEEVCNLISVHHERWDGGGYPHHLAGEAIPLGARIINVCDMYDNLSHGYQIAEAIEFLYGAGGLYFDSNVVKALCNNFAIYPLGSLVQLSTGEIGVVINIRGMRPIIRVCFNRVNRPIKQIRDVDLSKEITVMIKKTYI